MLLQSAPPRDAAGLALSRWEQLPAPWCVYPTCHARVKILAHLRNPETVKCGRICCAEERSDRWPRCPIHASEKVEGTKEGAKTRIAIQIAVGIKEDTFAPWAPIQYGHRICVHVFCFTLNTRSRV
jgi:hypothetical protein